MSEPDHEHDISLRPCTYADLGQIHTIERESFPEGPYPTIVFINLLMLARKGFIVACSGDSIVGYVIGTSIGGEGMIQSMAVTPSLRMRGVGARLMGSVIEHLSKNHLRISLLVDVSNEVAIHLYRKFSFSETGRVIKAYYPNGNDAIEMARETDSDWRGINSLQKEAQLGLEQQQVSGATVRQIRQPLDDLLSRCALLTPCRVRTQSREQRRPAGGPTP